MENNKGLTIVIDFDGTCVTHEFPKVGKDIGAIPVLKELIEKGHKLVLFTMRSDDDNGPSEEFPDEHGGTYLTDAVNWFKENNIPLYGIQRNPEQTWTTSPKAYGQLYIDDASICTPLIYPEDGSRPYVNWIEIEKELIKLGILE